MTPTSPKFNFAHQAGPSSPPATPTFKKPHFSFPRNRRQGFKHTFPEPLDTHEGTITSTGDGNSFSYNPSYNPFNHLDLELSPRSSSPTSTIQASYRHDDDSDANSIRPHSSSSSVGMQPVSRASNTRRTTKGDLVVEEFAQEDYEAFDSDAESILRPHQYEDADSERARSTRGSNRGSTKAVSPPRDLDPNILYGISNLDCDSEVDEREAWLASERAMRRRKRRSSGFSKRSHAQSVGSDTDDDDILPKLEGINEAGSSARRLRRKVAGDKSSLIFDDPPPRIDELDEPESSEEVLIEEADGEGQNVFRNLPYYPQMDVDSDDE
ncbi:hypothetical protein BJ878DRAFT_110378 [Calycina marina]|uniref:Uncharacterized protein n=1 Tax=Calycina marina TaxID=1763456 RepID=A0A9P8CFR6_9HELO|nr:hypothetical protein BJ878DRAFT_110378 [Calycina marina]